MEIEQKIEAWKKLVQVDTLVKYSSGAEARVTRVSDRSLTLGMADTYTWPQFERHARTGALKPKM